MILECCKADNEVLLRLSWVCARLHWINGMNRPVLMATLKGHGVYSEVCQSIDLRCVTMTFGVRFDQPLSLQTEC